jgi:hypothetical protein
MPKKGEVIEFRCHRCNWCTGYYARIERHVDAHGGGRIEVLIPQVA